MMKCLEVKVGLTEPSYHSAIRCNSDSRSCDALENRAHRLASIESATAVRVRKAVLLEFPVRRFWAVWASWQLLDRITRLLEEGKEEFGFRNLPLCNAARTARLDKRNVRNTNEAQDVPQIWDLVVIRFQWGSGIDAAAGYSNDDLASTHMPFHTIRFVGERFSRPDDVIDPSLEGCGNSKVEAPSYDLRSDFQVA